MPQTRMRTRILMQARMRDSKFDPQTLLARVDPARRAEAVALS